MSQAPNLFGRYRPPTGIEIRYVPTVDGEWLGGKVTLHITYHQPKPPIIEQAELNEWASAYLSALFTHVWDAMKYGSAEQAVLAFHLQVRRLNSEWSGP